MDLYDLDLVVEADVVGVLYVTGETGLRVTW